jgi:monoamine oxidase
MHSFRASPHVVSAAMTPEPDWRFSAFEWNRLAETGVLVPYDPEVPDVPFAFPKRLADAPPIETRESVCVIGGGLAGLAATYELLARSFEVTLLEKTDRLGGRVLTVRDGGLYGELGAMRVPDEHGCVKHYAELFFEADERVRFTYSDVNTWWHLKGHCNQRKNVTEEELGRWFGLKGVTVQPGHLLKDLLQPAATAIIRWDVFANTLTDETLVDLDRQSLASYVKQSLVKLGRWDPDRAWEYAGHGTGAWWMGASSLLHFLREFALLDATANHWTIHGGLGRLADAFEQAITNRDTHVIAKESRVTRMNTEGPDVEVTWEHKGEVESSRFDFVICAIPVAQILDIEFVPGLPHPKEVALRNLSHLSTAKSVLFCERSPWRTEDIRGGWSQTDLALHQIFYPSVREAGPPAPARRLPARLDFDPADPVAARSFRAWTTGPQTPDEPSVLTASYTWAARADALNAMDPDERFETVFADVQRVHSDLRREHIFRYEHSDWTGYGVQSTADGGSVAWFGPEEHTKYQSALCAPLMNRAEQPRVFFAGEHVGIAHGWIQSAIQSSLAATVSIIEMVRRR